MNNKTLLRFLAALLVVIMLIPMAAGAQSPKFGTLLALQQDWESRWPAVNSGVSEIPQYFQTDYYHVPYRRGTIASGGCGIVCLAMAASYLLDREFTPEYLAEHYSYLSGTNVDRYNAISEDLELPYVGLATKWAHVVQALQKGQLVVLLLNSGSPLTATQHFVLLSGITPEGKILVMDPYEPNYSEYPLSFARGFEQHILSDGFDGAWIYEKQPRNASFDRAVLEIYTGIRGRNAILELWFSGES